MKRVEGTAFDERQVRRVAERVHWDLSEYFPKREEKKCKRKPRARK
jgi:hypothetical protein